jgi:hypothetical protein
MHTGKPRTAEPYQRVVGVETAAGLVACRFEITTPVTSMSFMVPKHVSEHAQLFFDTHIARHDPEHPGSPEQQAVRAGRTTAGPTRYNCHTLALAILGEEELNVVKAGKRLSELEEGYTSFEGNLAAGQHGIIRNQDTGNVSHSTVGLGADVPLSLQVVNNNSNMGLMTYDSMMAEYAVHRSGYVLLA